MNQLHEKILLHRIRTLQDQKAFGRLYEEYKERVVRLLALKLPSQHDVEEALSETFTRTWNYTTGTSVDHFGGLLFTIARSVIADFYRKRPYEVELKEHNHPVGDTADSIQATVDIGFVKEAIKKIKEEYQIVIILKHFEGLSIHEISKQIQKNEGATRVILNRALKELRKHL